MACSTGSSHEDLQAGFHARDPPPSFLEDHFPISRLRLPHGTGMAARGLKEALWSGGRKAIVK
jgi:hypothetical protein